MLVLDSSGVLAASTAPAAPAAPVASTAPTPPAAPRAPAASSWVEGRNYFLIKPPRATDLPKGKVEVTEVFSYACPACNAFQPTMQRIKASLPPNAVLDFLPAAFNTAEDWPMFQQAYCTAQALGIADATHGAIFDAVWGSGELAVVDPGTGRLKAHPPTVEDAARVYEKQAHVPAAKFVATARSFQVDACTRRAEDLIKAFSVDRTPTLIVNGKYRVNVESAGGRPEDVIELVKYLVAQESR
jgi:thiol:disulfide interchange protein DsbA